MLSIEEIKKTLKENDLRALKALGQNFLIDEEALEKIVKAAELSQGDAVLEVGPGLGTLTEELSKNCKKIVAIEKDRRFAPSLKSKFKNVEVIEGDVLKLNINEIISKNFEGGKYKLVANIPYYITSKIIKLFLENVIEPQLIVFLVQKEVAERICEKAGSHSILSLSVQIFGRPEIISYVGRNSFYPIPEVDSAILRIKDIKKDKPEDYYRRMFRVIKVGFSSKRKKLSNNLSAGFQEDKVKVEEKLSKIGIGPNKRAQELDIKDWEKIADLF